LNENLKKSEIASSNQMNDTDDNSIEALIKLILKNNIKLKFHYFIEVFFTIINMESVVFLVDDKYKYAFTLSKNEDYSSDLNNLVYVLKGDLDKDKNTQSFYVTMMTLYTRFLQFKILKQSYNSSSL
jgi:hypothetical protein